MKIVMSWLALVITYSIMWAPSSSASSCTGSTASDENVFIASGECMSDADHTKASSSAAEATSTAADYYTQYMWRLSCGAAVGVVHTCADVCPDGQVLYELRGLHDDVWFPLEVRCATDPPDVSPTVTPALVARAFQRIPLPSLRSVTQPANKTLINFDTIFYVDAQPLHRTLTLLGQRVELEITPSTFRWVHGDGTTGVTHTAGAAYPAKDVVYRYQHAHTTVRQHVEIVWTARWSLDGGPFQDVDGTVTTVGPETPLRVAEATPALSGYGH